MKTAAVTRKTYVPLPNAATRRQLLQKYIDKLLLIASGVGVFVALMVLIALC